MRVMNPAALPQFYIDVYKLKEEEKALGDPNSFLPMAK
jgi:hypothetical protein